MLWHPPELKCRDEYASHRRHRARMPNWSGIAREMGSPPSSSGAPERGQQGCRKIGHGFGGHNVGPGLGLAG